jgi:ubiquinone/menaquinone biosynthesis C-methylase UbiE
MAFSDPAQILDQVGLSEGHIVADLGAGSGFYTLAAAKLVGSGKVYAVDVQADLLARIKNAAHAANLHNIEVLHGDMERLGGTRIRECSVDIALICNVLFQVEKKDDFLNEVKRILKPGGRVVLVDWADSFGGMGPAAEHVISEQDAEELFKKHGFTFINSIDAGDNHYGHTYHT